MKRPIRIAITTGDIDGIGTEVATKALAKIKPQKGVIFYLWRSPQCPSRHQMRLGRTFKRRIVTSWHEAFSLSPTSEKEIIEINSNLSPAHWVQTSAEACMLGSLDGIATGPLSKTVIRECGMSDVGHTEILSRVAKRKDLFMGFLGKHFNVVLATGHVSLKSVSAMLTGDRLLKSVVAANRVRQSLPKKRGKLPIGVLGINPHSGEEGLIGDEETRVYGKLFEDLKELKISVAGPLVPDAAFLKECWDLYSVYVAAYHDQGLIPFKAFHGHGNGVHVTLGLPFVRTSVAHGTAKDIFKKEKADPSSMVEAIHLAIQMCQDVQRDPL